MTLKSDYEKMKEEMIYYKRKSEDFLLEIIRLNNQDILSPQTNHRLAGDKVNDALDYEVGNKTGDTSICTCGHEKNLHGDICYHDDCFLEDSNSKCKKFTPSTKTEPTQKDIDYYEYNFNEPHPDTIPIKRGCGRKFNFGWTCSNDGLDNHKLCDDCLKLNKNEVNSPLSSEPSDESPKSVGLTNHHDKGRRSGDSSEDLHSQNKELLDKDYDDSDWEANRRSMNKNVK